jgi:hypothetical protein
MGPATSPPDPNPEYSDWLYGLDDNALLDYLFGIYGKHGTPAAEEAVELRERGLVGLWCLRQDDWLGYAEWVEELTA